MRAADGATYVVDKLDAPVSVEMQAGNDTKHVKVMNRLAKGHARRTTVQ